MVAIPRAAALQVHSVQAVQENVSTRLAANTFALNRPQLADSVKSTMTILMMHIILCLAID